MAALPALLSTRSNVLTVITPYNEMKAILKALTDVYIYDILWVPIVESTSDASISPADLTNIQSAIFAVQVSANVSRVSASVPVNTQACYAYDAIIAWSRVLSNTANVSNNAQVVASIRSLSSIPSGMTASGAIQFGSSGERSGDVVIINYKKSGSPVISRWNGPVLHQHLSSSPAFR